MHVDSLDNVRVGSLEPVLEGDIIASLNTPFFEINGVGYYSPPVSFDQLTKLMRMSPHHESALNCKTQAVMLGFKSGGNQVISRNELKRAVMDRWLTGNYFLRIARNRKGEVTRLYHLNARTMRRGKEPNSYFQLRPDGSALRFEPDEIIHGMHYAPETSIYGLPEYLGAVYSILLNRQGTLFRRKFYVNGAHMGFLLVTQGEDIGEETAKSITEKVKETKGVGNFQSMHLHLGAEGKAELIPVGEFAKDDFEKIKHASQADILSAHQTPASILAVVVGNQLPVSNSLGHVVAVFASNVITPVQLDMKEDINYHLEENQWIDFTEYNPLPKPMEG